MVLALRLKALIISPNLKTPQAGLEPATNRLTADRSTTELLRHFFYTGYNNIKYT